MFSGIIAEAGHVVHFERRGSAWRLRVAADRIGAEAAIGDSVAVNGCCLTVVAAAGGVLDFDVLEETCRLTNLPGLRAGDRVNLESSLRVGDQLGGHFVSGHVDGTGKILAFDSPAEGDRCLRIAAPPGSGRYLLLKGSVAIDGISLTVSAVNGDEFEVRLIPHTIAVTNLSRRRAGDHVNLEFDLLGKYVEKLLGSTPGKGPSR